MTQQDTLTLLACQIDIPHTTSAAARDGHLAAIAAKVRQQLRTQTADLVVLPELSSIDYSRAAFDHLEEIAEPREGASFRTWQSVATEFGVHVVFGFARKDASGAYISIGVVTPDGALAGHYDKLHLCQYGASMEKEYFITGDHLFTFKVKSFTLSPIICYDIRFPELTRTLVLKHGVDILLHSVANFRDRSFHMWHAFAMTRAVENQCFLLSLNRAGTDYGDSLFCYPWMDETQGPLRFDEHGEDFRFVTVNQHHISDARRDYTFLKDIRDSYDSPLSRTP
ncbi:carbon-nitrogen hydrolase family protein [Sulfitobacter sp. F26169L]|uniref:carbon-nitrogen hydrolase family protein n=1 Tax=Sulfitobacter sp. F26169L TaxID=2996015 RepID=UPI0022608D29|nr:carbon-nitrogen hydrolase family protein [Sulfitobacter sp. F26169L]MCX7567899.1 carbon-nitrogen hydrolase family protein [Sulfitobacter sp. F26169L]